MPNFRLFVISIAFVDFSSSLLKCESAPVSSTNTHLSSMGATCVARAAIAQLRSTSNKHANLINVAQCAGLAKKAGADMLFLPECLGFVGDNAAHTLEQADPPINICDQTPENEELVPNPFREALCNAIISPDDITLLERANHVNNNLAPPIVKSLQFIARESGMWISGGGVHTRVPVSATSADQQKIYNTHVIIDSSGQIKSYYHKIHLFDVSIPNKVNLQESKTTAPGTTLEVCDSPLGKLGLTICYDMRFSEMYVDLLKKGAQILLVPSAFTVPTGKAHWHALLRARAIESQCYVIAAAQVGKHNEKRESYGHSLVYNPWGELLADAGGYDSIGTDGIAKTSDDGVSPVIVPSICIVDVDLKMVDSVRESMPIQEHRTNSKYTF